MKLDGKRRKASDRCREEVERREGKREKSEHVAIGVTSLIAVFIIDPIFFFIALPFSPTLILEFLKSTFKIQNSKFKILFFLPYLLVSTSGNLGRRKPWLYLSSAHV